MISVIRSQHFRPSALLFPFLIVLILFLFSCAPQAQDEKQYRVGVLNYSEAAEKVFAGFKKGMTDLGYREGNNITYLYAGFIPEREKLRAEAKRLVKERVDLLFSISTPATLIAKEVTTNTSIPVIFGPVSNPVESGIVKDLKSPEGNITGVTFRFQEPKRLEVFKEIAPAIKQIAFPYNPEDKSPQLNLLRLQELASELEVTIIPFPLHNEEEIDAFLAAIPEDINAIYMPTDALMAARSRDFIAKALERKLPLTTPAREGVYSGALVSYGMSMTDIGRQAARLADQVFRGVPARELPVELSEFATTINVRTAEAIGIHVPDSMLRRAIVIR